MDDLLGLSTEAFSILWEGIGYNDIFPLRVTGTSMVPFLLDRQSVAYITKKEKYHCKRGDIYLYQREDGAFVLHRIYRVLDEEWFLMNGDSQVYLERVHRNQIKAECVKIRRTRKLIHCSNPFYRLCVRLWQSIRRFRPYLFQGKNIVQRKLRRLCGKD